MDPVGLEACGGDGGEGFFEAAALGAGVGGVGDFWFGEVGEDAFEAEERLAFEPVEEGVEMFAGGDALAGHAGVDFEVDRQRGGVALCWTAAARDSSWCCCQTTGVRLLRMMVADSSGRVPHMTRICGWL